MDQTCTHCAARHAALSLSAQSGLLSRKEAALYLGVSENTLAIWQSTGRYSLPMVKIGRLAKYRKVDLDAFIASRMAA
jgi:excisionase family DNA binding protein